MMNLCRYRTHSQTFDDDENCWLLDVSGELSLILIDVLDVRTVVGIGGDDRAQPGQHPKLCQDVSGDDSLEGVLGEGAVVAERFHDQTQHAGQSAVASSASSCYRQG
jgi:hypothetical protein